jgi:hypothetical protein
MKDDKNVDLEINQFIIDNARSRYYAMPQRSAGKENALEDINELAKKLGFY